MKKTIFLLLLYLPFYASASFLSMISDDNGMVFNSNPKNVASQLFQPISLEISSNSLKNSQTNPIMSATLKRLKFSNEYARSPFTKFCLAKMIEAGLYRIPQITGLRFAPKFRNILSLVSNQSYKYIIQYEETGFVAVIKGTCATYPQEIYSLDQVTYTPNSVSGEKRLRAQSPIGYTNADSGDICLGKILQAGLYNLPDILKNQIPLSYILNLGILNGTKYNITWQKEGLRARVEGTCKSSLFGSTLDFVTYEREIPPIIGNYPINKYLVYPQGFYEGGLHVQRLQRIFQVIFRAIPHVIDLGSLSFGRLTIKSDQIYEPTQLYFVTYYGVDSVARIDCFFYGRSYVPSMKVYTFKTQSLNLI